MNRATLLFAATIALLGGHRSVLLAQQASLTPPRQVWAAQTGSKEIMLVWKRAPDAEGYRISPVGNTPRRSLPTGTLAKNVDHVSISLSSPFAASYSYEITAVYSGGRLSRKVQSNTVTPVVVKPGPADSPPAQVEATETTPGVITVTWSKVPSATGYQIGRSVAPAGLKQLCQVCSTATTYVDRKVTAGAKHIYTVAALTPKGPTRRTVSNPVTPIGESSDTIEADSAESVAAGAPEPPKNVRVVAATGHSFELSWDRAEGAISYEISRRINNGESRLLATSSSTRYVDNQASVDAKGALSYGVTALNANGRSEEVDATVHDTTTGDPGSKAAIDLKASRKSANSVLLTWGWGGVGGLIPGHRYALRRRVAGGLPTLVATIAGTISSYLDRLAAGVGGQLAYFLEDYDGKGAASDPAFVTIDIAGIDSAKARSDSASPLPKAPSDLKAAIIGPDVIRLDWNLNAIGGAALGMVSPAVKVVNIYRGTVGRALTLIGTVQRTVSSFIDHLPSGWSTGGPVVYAVEAVNEKGASPRSSISIEPGKVSSDTAGAPKGLSDVRAEPLSPTTVGVTWKGFINPGAVVQVLRGPVNGALQVIANLDPTLARFVDHVSEGDLVGGLRYALRVVNGTSASEQIVVSIDPRKTRADTSSLPPIGVKDLKATVLSPTSIQLTYSTSVGATTLRILRRVASGPYEVIATVAGSVSSYIDRLTTAMMQGGVGYAVEAVNDKGVSEQVSVAVDPQKSLADSTMDQKGPANPKAVRTLPLQIAVTWGPIEGAIEYEVRRAIANGVFQIVAQVGPAITQFLDQLPPGTPAGAVVRYGITAINPKGRSVESIVEVPPDKQAVDSSKSTTGSAGNSPTNPRAKVAGDGAVALEWGVAQGATSYQIERSLDGSPYEVIATLPGTVLQYVDQLEDLLASHPVYRIIALGPQGPSQPIRFIGLLERRNPIGTPKSPTP